VYIHGREEGYDEINIAIIDIPAGITDTISLTISIPGASDRTIALLPADGRINTQRQ